mgnify:FL=1
MGQQGQGRQGRATVQAAGLTGQLWGQLGGSEDVSEGLCVSYTSSRYHQQLDRTDRECLRSLQRCTTPLTHHHQIKPMRNFLLCVSAGCVGLGFAAGIQLGNVELNAKQVSALCLTALIAPAVGVIPLAVADRLS